jgi:hypothetical protein
MANNDGGIAYERVGGTRLAAADEDSSSAAVYVDPFAEAAPVFSDDDDDGGGAGGGAGASAPALARRSSSAGAASSSSSSSSSSSPAAAFGHLSDLELAHALGFGGGASRLPSAGDALRLGGGGGGEGEDGARGGGGGGGRHGERPMLVQERRGLWGACSYNIGYAYFGGLAAGGAFGVLQGVRSSPNAKPRIVLNSVLNATGKFGARAGNAAGVLALLFTVTERQLEDLELDKLPGALNSLAAPLLGGRDLFRAQRADGIVPLATAFATGALFTLPRAASMRGVDRLHVSLLKRGAVCLVGGLACTAGVGALSALAPLLLGGGGRSPFRFA